MSPDVRLIGATVPVDDPDYPESLGFTTALDLIEFAGRWDYGAGSVAKMTGDPEAIIARWMAGGEESMVEMGSATFLITCSRVVSHELVRHRIASYQQESQRFVAYESEDPLGLFYGSTDKHIGAVFSRLYEQSMVAYRELRAAGVPKQIARYVLPNATRTRIIASMNLREWRHVLRLRMHTSAQPEMQEVMRLVHGKLQHRFGAVLFPDDIAAERGTR